MVLSALESFIWWQGCLVQLPQEPCRVLSRKRLRKPVAGDQVPLRVARHQGDPSPVVGEAPFFTSVCSRWCADDAFSAREWADDEQCLVFR